MKKKTIHGLYFHPSGKLFAFRDHLFAKQFFLPSHGNAPENEQIPQAQKNLHTTVTAAANQTEIFNTLVYQFNKWANILL